ncbi:glucose 1-dehydrogenase [Nocardia miyunensis]|uniref:glucose 1-dehydrogenase n=1 Tax=Nocardia miyunensis TaxID=282684 RepID=UPI00082A8B10|nr:glucose 1-dehydrogenase [Nocardia miyunensis]
MMELNGKVAVVTGGASGIGAATCALLARSRARVVVTDVDDARGEAVAAELGENALYLHADVTREQDFAAAIRTATERFGRLDAMVNNAGRVGAWTYLEDITLEEWDATFAVLARSAFLGTKHAARVMREQGSGAIVNISSVAGLRTGFGPHPYGASKAAILQMTRSAARELAPLGVRVNAVTPGGIATRIQGHGAGLEGEALDASIDNVRQGLRTFQPIPRAGEGADIAGAIAYLVSDAASFVTGQNIVVDGGLTLGKGWPSNYRAEADATAQSRRPD